MKNLIALTLLLTSTIATFGATLRGVGYASDTRNVSPTDLGVMRASNFTAAVTLNIGSNDSPGLLILTGTNISGAPTNTGIILTNSDAALVGVQKFAPVIQQWGNGWKTTATAASQPIGVQYGLEPVQGTTTPTANWTLRFSTNGPPFGATPGMTLSSGGLLTTSAGMTSGGNILMPGGFYIGTVSLGNLYPAADGHWMFRNAAATSFRNLTFGGTGQTNFQLQLIPVSTGDSNGTVNFRSGNTNSFSNVGAGSLDLAGTNTIGAPQSANSQMGGQIFCDGTNLVLVVQNAAGTRTTNKLSMTAWP